MCLIWSGISSSTQSAYKLNDMLALCWSLRWNRKEAVMDGDQHVDWGTPVSVSYDVQESIRGTVSKRWRLASDRQDMEYSARENFKILITLLHPNVLTQCHRGTCVSGAYILPQIFTYHIAVYINVVFASRDIHREQGAGILHSPSESHVKSFFKIQDCLSDPYTVVTSGVS